MDNMKELKGEIDNSTIIIGDFKASLSIMARKKQTKKQQGNRRHNTITQPALRHIYRTIYLTIAKYISILLKYA